MKPLVVSGFMGTGKTTVGGRLAGRLGLPWVDIDARLEAECGKTIREIWETEGEAGLRTREAALAETLLNDPTPRVIAFGGGTVAQEHVRRLATQRTFVTTLTAGRQTLMNRLGNATSRPNLKAPDLNRRIQQLLAERRGAYAECHLTVPTDDLSVDDVVDRIIAGALRDPLLVPLGTRSYVVDVVRGAPGALADAIVAAAPSSIVWVCDANVRRGRGAALREALGPLRIPLIEVVLPAGESHKVLSTVATIWDAALGTGVDRNTLVLATGGGVVGDIAGFAASTLLRGLRWVQVPTTLLAMVDASVGGKTGFDHLTGKNLIGTFHQPRAVIADLAHLGTLPPRELRAGWAEVVKIALIANESLLTYLENSAEGLLALNSDELAHAVRSSIGAKIRIVCQDEFEMGTRALLNAGHTVGHALEGYTGYQGWLHGEAVSLGLLAELKATTRLGITAAGVFERTRLLLERFGLPISLDRDELLAAWAFVSSDKKRRGGYLALPAIIRAGEAQVITITLEEFRKAAIAG